MILPPKHCTVRYNESNTRSFSENPHNPNLSITVPEISYFSSNRPDSHVMLFILCEV